MYLKNICQTFHTLNQSKQVAYSLEEKFVKIQLCDEQFF